MRPMVPIRQLYACLAEGGIIILDLASERYYGVEMPRHDALTDSGYRELIGASPTRDIIDPAELTTVSPAPAGTIDALLHTSALLMAALFVLTVRARLGTRGVLRCIERLRKAHPIPERRDSVDEGLARAVYYFRHLRPFLYTAHDHCLLDALILTYYMLRLGHDAAFVIGVRQRPFEAHAWARCGNLLLDDFPERVRLYTPLLIA